MHQSQAIVSLIDDPHRWRRVRRAHVAPAVIRTLGDNARSERAP
jgi:hypothetical protein